MENVHIVESIYRGKLYKSSLEVTENKPVIFTKKDVLHEILLKDI